jgi:hypothetical protein
VLQAAAVSENAAIPSATMILRTIVVVLSTGSLSEWSGRKPPEFA